MVLLLLSYLSNEKVINNKPSPLKTIIGHLMTSGVKTIDLRSNLIEKRYQDIKKAPQ